MNAIASLLFGGGVFVGIIGLPFVFVYLLALANNDRIWLEMMRVPAKVYIACLGLGGIGAILLTTGAV